MCGRTTCVCKCMCLHVFTHKYIYSIHIYSNLNIYYKYIYIAFIYLSRQVCSFMPQWPNPSNFNQVKGRGEEEYMTYGEHEALVRGKPSKLKLGSVFSFEMQAPPRSSHEEKTRNGNCTRPKAPLKDINLPPLQRPTTLATTDRY